MKNKKTIALLLLLLLIPIAYLAIPSPQTPQLPRTTDPAPVSPPDQAPITAAAPHVSGIVGLILSKFPHLDHVGLKEALVNTVDKVPALAGKIASGGRVKALSLAPKRVRPVSGSQRPPANPKGWNPGLRDAAQPAGRAGDA